MNDVIGAISLTALFGICCAVLITVTPVDAAARSRLAVTAVLWFVGVGSLAAFGVFAPAGAGASAIGLAILAPVGLSLYAASRPSTVRTVALDTPLAVLVALHAGRVLGIFFLLLFGAGRLPPTFAMTAGWGDIGVGITALPRFSAASRGGGLSHWRGTCSVLSTCSRP